MKVAQAQAISYRLSIDIETSYEDNLLNELLLHRKNVAELLFPEDKYSAERLEEMLEEIHE